MYPPKGKFPVEIFREAGFNLNIIGNQNPRKCINRWKRTYLTIVKDGLTGEKRGTRWTLKKMTPPEYRNHISSVSIVFF